nr:immunoglobulin light chain junction region [Macaca mulatta]MPO03494.1 immunoglobulin light chain junction region [Macaca mulatta]MPO04308.1 immunoglobulin light chain junction region [Macaca mulatta]MPO04708.1 immunoglobulin light chain junction region [Macaca mulatta]MPO04910.1 immunoglobulin light chain junction region [Macaca mulatta]
CSSHAGSNVLF